MNQTIQTVLIVDDEAPARQRLERLVDALPGWKCVGSCADGAEAIQRAARIRPAVVLLDIRMPGMSGIEVARHLSRLDSPPAVIFATAYDEYAVEAFDARAVGYLVKPVRRERLEHALAHPALLSDVQLCEIGESAQAAEPRRYLAVRERAGLKLIPLSDVRYFQAEQKYVTVGHQHGEHLIEDSLRQLEDEFADRFVRIHRSVLVALDAIERLDKDSDGAYQVSLRGGQLSLPVSRRQLTQLKTRLAAGR